MDQFKDDILQPIQNDALIQIRDMYAKNWPDKIYIYYYIDMAYTWITKHNSCIRFYSVEGNFDDGTVVLISNEYDNSTRISCFTLDKSNSRLYTALTKTKRINWNKDVELVLLYRNQIPLACDIAKENGLHLGYIDPAAYWWIPKEKALEFEFDIPNNTFLGSLTIAHAEKIYNVWPHRNCVPIDYIKNLIKNNSGIGLFDKNDKTLLAWITRNDFGTLAILQTDDDHRRKGYATIVTKALCKQFAENNIDPICIIILGNIVSEALFSKLGFQVIDYISWIKYVRVNYS